MRPGAAPGAARTGETTMYRQHFALAGCLAAGCLLASQAPAAAAELWIGPNGTGIPVVVKPPPAPPAPVERPEVILPRPAFMRVSMEVLVDGKPLRTVTHH